MSLASDTAPTIHSPRPGRAAARIHPLSPRSPVVPAGGLSSPPPALPHPEPSDHSPENVNAPPESLESNGDPASAAAQGKKQAWSRPSNGSIEAGPVMGADSWPALSESTRAAPKSSSTNSLKTLSDGSISAPPGPVIASTSPKPNTSNPNPNPAPNHAAPARQKSMKRGGGSGASSGTQANGGLAPPPQSLAQVEMYSAALDKPDGLEPSPRGPPNMGSSNWDNGSRVGGFMHQSYGGGDHPRSYSGHRRGSGGGGGGGSHNGGFGGRDAHVPLQQHRGHMRPFLRPPPPPPLSAAVTAPFISPLPPVRPFVNPMGFPEIPPVYYVQTHPLPESLHGLPFVAHPLPHAIPPPMFVPAPDHQRAKLVKQIDYYFSNENLCKDVYLRQNMDYNGWVSVSLIATFNQVKKLTNNIPYILDAVRSSTIVEVQGEKIRRRNDWMNWTLPPLLNQHGTTSSQSSLAADYEAMAAHMQSVGLEEGNTSSCTAWDPASTEVEFSRPVT